jgi:hypothetical protein
MPFAKRTGLPQGWVYVFGVGVAGGMVLKHLAAEAAVGGAARSP